MTRRASITVGAALACAMVGSVAPVAGAAADPSASITVNAGSGDIDASTYSWASIVVDNTSGSASITRVEFDLSTAVIPDVVFDDDDGSPAGDNVSKGLDINTSPGPLSWSSLSNPNGLGDEKLTIAYSSGVFSAGERLRFSIDIDPTTIQGANAPGPNEAGSVSGTELTGTTVTIRYSDGSTQAGRLFGDGSVGGAELELSAAAGPTTPTASIDGLAHGDASSDATRTVVVRGDGGDVIDLLHLEPGLYTTGAGAGYAQPLDGNSALSIDYHQGTIGPWGSTSVPLTLQTSTDSGNERPGLNYFVARATDPATGATSVSDPFIVRHTPTGDVDIEIGGVGVTEGTGGLTGAPIPITLTEPSSSTITVDYEAIDSHPNPSVSQGGQDHVSASGTLTFAPGDTVEYIPLQIIGDAVAEPPLLWGEWGLVRISDPTPGIDVTGGLFGHALFIIVDDD